jgi:hypothetical protein
LMIFARDQGFICISVAFVNFFLCGHTRIIIDA